MSLYENINKRKKAGTSRSKANTTIDPNTYAKMKAKKGGFALRKRKRKLRWYNGITCMDKKRRSK